VATGNLRAPYVSRDNFLAGPKGLERVRVVSTNSPTAVGLNLFSNLGLRDYLEIARRRRWWVILSSLGVFICTTIVVWKLPPIFGAETVILVDTSGVPDKYVPSMSTGDIAGRLTTLEQQVLSPSRLKKLVESEGLYPDGKQTEDQVVNRVQKSIIVEVVNPGGGKMSAFRIAYRSRKRSEVAPVANRLAQMFIEENLKARVNQTEETTHFLEDQLQDTKLQLDSKDTELRAVESRNILDLPESKQYHMEALANLRSQMVSIQDKIQQSEREKEVLQSLLISGTDAPTVDVDNAPGGSGGSYQVQIQKLESYLANLKLRYGPAHPEVRRTENEIAKLRSKAASEPESAPVLNPEVQVTQGRKKVRNPVLEAQIEKLDEQIKDQNKQLQPLQSQLAFHESKLQQLPAFEQKISRMRQDYDALRNQYSSLQGKEQAAKLSQALEVREKGEKFEVLDAAVTPNTPVAPNRPLLDIAGLIGGLLAGICLAAIAEMHDESVRTETEAAQIVGKNVLVGIPLILSAKERRSRRWRAVAMVGCTVAGAAALGFLLSFVSGGVF
jgi:succinoglycan biosynthesis transport protein ExoP